MTLILSKRFMMEQSTMQEWGYGYAHKDLDCWDASFINISDFDGDAFLDFDLSPIECPPWNDVSLEENEIPFISPSRSEYPASIKQDLVQIIELQNKGGDDLIIDGCPPAVEDCMLSDFNSSLTETPCNGLEAPSSMTAEFSSMEEDFIMDVIELPNDSERIMMEEPMDSEGVCESSYRDDFSISHHQPSGAEVSSLRNKSMSSEYSINSAVSDEFDCSVTASIPWSSDSEEYKGLRLVHLLTACAEAISDGAYGLVEIILCRLRELVSATGSTMQRVAYYLFHSLQQRHHNSAHMEGHMFRRNYNSTKDPNYVGAFSLLNQVYPYIRFAHFTANQSILEAITGRSQNVHIIDFDIMEGMQWPPLMEALISENYKIGRLKITAVNWDDDDDDSASLSSCCKTTGRRLSEYASSLGIPFSFEEAKLENVKGILRSNEEEVVIVNCMWELPHMFERSRKQLIEFLHGARDLNPSVMTLGTGPNGIVAHEKLSFLEQFSQCLKNLCAVFDSLEAGLPEQYGLARAMVERLFMGPMMCRPISHLSEEDSQVVDIALKCGFAEGDISKKNASYGKYMVEEGKYYQVEIVGNNKLVLMWESTPLTCVSMWKPTNLV